MASNLEEFMKSVGTAMRPHMNMSVYNGDFDCACGSSHHYGYHIKLLCEGRMRVVMVCPNDSSYLTNVAIKTFLLVKFKGFESLCGFQIQTDEDQELIMATLKMLR